MAAAVEEKYTETIYMLKQKFIAVAAMAVLAIIIGQSNAFAFGGNTKKQVSFKVRVENISNKDGIAASDGTRYPFALSPGFYAVTGGGLDFFKAGAKASGTIEAQAEDGSPEMLSKVVLAKQFTGSFGIFNKPTGADMPSPILPGGAYKFNFMAKKGMTLNLVTMFGQSNDLFYAPAKAIALFDDKGNPVTGDITNFFELWDAGTEVNQAPGIGADQGPRQKAKNTGAAESGVVRLVNDGFVYPNTKDVLRITISAN